MGRKIIAVLVAISVIALASCQSCDFGSKPAIKVGLLFSLTGTMAMSEKAMVDATLLAIEEINEAGGVLKQRIEPIVVDTKSDWQYAATMAEKLIVDDKVSAVFGCWTSVCRRTVKPVFEKYNAVLFYSVQYEGLEESKNIVYAGAAPNQQIIPAVKWAFDNLGKKFFLVGSDYIFPRTANEIIKEQIKALGGQVVGEEYVLLGGKDFRAITNKIKNSDASVVLNTLNGDSNVAFFKDLRENGITPNKKPTFSFSISEEELNKLDIESMVGDYGAWSYFQSLNTKENLDFVKRFKKRYGDERVIGDPMEAAYFAVFLWAQAVKDANQSDSSAITKFVQRQSYNAPEGLVYIDPENQHTWKSVKIGKILPNGQYQIVWSSEKPIFPIPYPSYRTEVEWKRFLDDIYRGWGNRWENPGDLKNKNSAAPKVAP